MSGTEDSRQSLFISHANPEDNAFALWLGAKLAAMGYDVWADVMRLHGGSDWSRDLEHALRSKAAKMLLVCTPIALEKQGVRNEIEIGIQTSNRINDARFIIPLRLKPYDPPFRIAHIQYIDFSQSWASGLTELIDTLTNVYRITPNADRTTSTWLSVQSRGETHLKNVPELLTSNWMIPLNLPRHIYYCEIDASRPFVRGLWPIVPFKNGVLTFAHPDTDRLCLPDAHVHGVSAVLLDSFLHEGWGDLGIERYQARRQFSDLGNQALDTYLKKRGLKCYEGANRRKYWWGDTSTAPESQISFRWGGHRVRRQIIGFSAKRRVHWHFAVNAQLRTSPTVHVRVSSRIVFSSNGLDAIDSHSRMHTLRRSFAKSWRNARWRDLLLAYLWWISDGRLSIQLPVSSTEHISLAARPMRVESPVSVLHVDVGSEGEDDPELSDGDFYHLEEQEESGL